MKTATGAEKARVLAAAGEYVDRKTRVKHPDGKFGNGQRWYPSESEKQECCSGIRSPSWNWPNSLMVHCRTADHVAHLYGVDPKELKRKAKQINVIRALDQAVGVQA